jgi:short-subunit dehydrogenase
MRTARHILITGAAGAIGSALAARFAARHPEARLTLVDVAEAPLRAVAAALGPLAEARRWDLTQVDALPGLWRELTDARGPVDVLVNCAGLMDILSIGGTGWSRGATLLGVNLLGPLRLIDLALPEMGRGGCIVNVSSMAGRVPLKGCTYYGAAKAGLAMASEIAHVELAVQGIHVVTVYPGPVASGLEAHARGQVARSLVAKYIPTGTPEVLAGKIVDACDRGVARVVYPSVYGVPFVLNALAARVTASVGPEPLR